MQRQGRKLMEQVAKVIASLPNKLSITGHTDATPFSSRRGYGNWELSTDRANASRATLVAAGVPPSRIAKVTGKADHDPLDPEDPTRAENRRISIVLLRQSAALRGAPAEN